MCARVMCMCVCVYIFSFSLCCFIVGCAVLPKLVLLRKGKKEEEAEVFIFMFSLSVFPINTKAKPELAEQTQTYSESTLKTKPEIIFSNVFFRLFFLSIFILVDSLFLYDYLLLSFYFIQAKIVII